MNTATTHSEATWELTPEEAAYMNLTFADTTVADAERLLLTTIEKGLTTIDIRQETPPFQSHQLTEKGNMALRNASLAPPGNWLNMGFYQHIISLIEGGSPGQWHILDFLAAFCRNFDSTYPHGLTEPFINQCEEQWEQIHNTAYDNYVVESVLLCLCGIELYNKFTTPQ